MYADERNGNEDTCSDAGGLSFSTLEKAHPGSGRPVDEAGAGKLIGEVRHRRLLMPEPQFELEADARRALFRPAVNFATGGGPAFSVDKFAENLRKRLDGNCVGWTFVINMNGQEARCDQDGTAITPGDQDNNGETIGTRDMTPNTRVNIASVSKTITAVAVLRLLRANNLGTLTPIWPYLPPNWTLGPRVESLRFHHLLTHTSGLGGVLVDDVSDEGLSLTLALGANPGAPYKYLNANFALFRVIIPALWSNAGLELANNGHPVASAFYYAAYVIEEMFRRMNGAIGANASTSVLDPIPSRYYLNTGSFLGIDFGNWAMISGGGGWHLTARELAAFLAHITYNDDVLHPDDRAGMDALRYGWQPASGLSGAFGQYFGHGGYLIGTRGQRQGRLRTGIMKFNMQVEASLVVNSLIGKSGAPPPSDGGAKPTSILREAYDAAWV